MKTGDIIRNVWCPSGDNPNRIAYVLKANGEKSTVMFMDGRVGTLNVPETSITVMGNDSFYVDGIKAALVRCAAVSDDTDCMKRLSHEAWEAEYGKRGVGQ